MRQSIRFAVVFSLASMAVWAAIDHRKRTESRQRSHELAERWRKEDSTGYLHSAESTYVADRANLDQDTLLWCRARRADRYRAWDSMALVADLLERSGGASDSILAFRARERRTELFRQVDPYFGWQLGWREWLARGFGRSRFQETDSLFSRVVREMELCTESHPGLKECHLTGVLALAEAHRWAECRTWTTRARNLWPQDEWFEVMDGIRSLREGDHAAARKVFARDTMKQWRYLGMELAAEMYDSRLRQIATVAFGALSPMPLLHPSSFAADSLERTCDQLWKAVNERRSAARVWKGLDLPDSATKYQAVVDSLTPLASHCYELEKRLHPRLWGVD